MMVALGVMTGLVGIDLVFGSSRLTFGRMELPTASTSCPSWSASSASPR